MLLFKYILSFSIPRHTLCLHPHFTRRPGLSEERFRTVNILFLGGQEEMGETNLWRVFKPIAIHTINLCGPVTFSDGALPPSGREEILWAWAVGRSRGGRRVAFLGNRRQHSLEMTYNSRLYISWWNNKDFFSGSFSFHIFREIFFYDVVLNIFGSLQIFFLLWQSKWLAGTFIGPVWNW